MALSSCGQMVYMKFGLPTPYLHIEEKMSGWNILLSDTNVDVQLDIIRRKTLVHREGEFLL